VTVIIFFALALTFSLQAKEPLSITSQAPPYNINVGDTSTSILPKLKSRIDSTLIFEADKKLESVEDTAFSNCDIIFYQSGKMQYCKIISTTPTTVSYKTCDRPDGLTIVANKSTIHKIKFVNGKEEIVNEKRKGKPYKPRDIWAVVSLVLGVLGIITVLLFGFVFIGLALTGLTLGIISFFTIKKSRKTDDEMKGSGTALLGILLNALALALVILLFI